MTVDWLYLTGRLGPFIGSMTLIAIAVGVLYLARLTIDETRRTAGDTQARRIRQARHFKELEQQQ